jgi:exopolysaccharide production protein ExoY
MQPPSNLGAFRVILSKYARTGSLQEAPAHQDTRSLTYDGRSPVWGQFSRSRAFRSPDRAEPDIALRAAPLGGRVKRCFDLTLALTTIILMAPTLLLITAMIYITMGRPIFFVQQRVGFGRRQFGCLKFRTMVTDADERLAAYLSENPVAALMWREKQKLTHDPRITWLGRILRKSSLDETPQLFNVLAGHMSCIGPRPVLPDELRRYGPHERVYAKARPGLTGMWQISGRSSTTYAQRVLCDCYYIRRWSLVLDAAILLKTVPAVMKFDETA